MSQTRELLPTRRTRSSEDLRELLLRTQAQVDERLNVISAQLTHIQDTTDSTHSATARIEQNMSVQRELLNHVLRATNPSREVWFVRGLLLALVFVVVLQIAF